MVKQISLHAAGNAERGAYGSKYGDNHLQDSFPNFLFHFLFPFFFLMVQQSVFFLNFRKFFPHTPFQGVLLLTFWAFSPYLNYIRKFSQFFFSG